MTYIENPPPDIVAMVRLHRLIDGIVHTNLVVSLCVCQQVVARQPVQTGETCHACGGMMTRTGTCYTCTECGETGGCG